MEGRLAMGDQELRDLASTLVTEFRGQSQNVIAVMRAGPGLFYLFHGPRSIECPKSETALKDGLEQGFIRSQTEGLWWAGVLSYNGARVFEPALEPSIVSSLVQDFCDPGSIHSDDLAQWGLFDSPVELRDADIPVLAGLVCNMLGHEYDYRPFFSPFMPSWDEERHALAVEQVKECLRNGTSYQMNLTFTLHSRLLNPLLEQGAWGQHSNRAWRMGMALAAWARLLDSGQGRYGAFWFCGGISGQDDTCIASLSPELFFERRGDNLTCRPMKGTAPRSANPEQDRTLALDLFNSAKNRAENLMITDMIRNDLGKIANPGSVGTENLFAVETYPTVHQLTSTVRATSTVGFMGILGALFPCASITGAPRISTMNALGRIEARNRGWYTGSAGWGSPGGDGLFNVLIRTLVIAPDGRLDLGVGGGIVWDSTAPDEYREAILKSRFAGPLLRDFDLVETLRWSDPQVQSSGASGASGGIPGPDGIHDHASRGGFWFFAQHAQRLCLAASAFGGTLNPETVFSALQDWVQSHVRCNSPDPDLPAANCCDWRVRIALSPDGRLAVSGQALECQFNGESAVAVGLSPIPLDPAESVFLRFKTNRRAVYERHALPQGIQTLFYTSEGLVTESATCNIVLKTGASWLTPRQNGMFLEGTYRRALLDQGRIQEASISIADLFCADSVWLINSVRGWIPARVSPKHVLETVVLSRSP